MNLFISPSVDYFSSLFFFLCSICNLSKSFRLLFKQSQENKLINFGAKKKGKTDVSLIKALTMISLPILLVLYLKQVRRKTYLMTSSGKEMLINHYQSLDFLKEPLESITRDMKKSPFLLQQLHQ